MGIAYQSKIENGGKFGKQFEINLATFKHPQETKSFNTDVSNPTPFVFGKLNKAAIAKFNYVLSKKVSEFTDAQRIGIDLLAGAGFSLGILKPIYLNFLYPDGKGSETVLTEKYDPQRHTERERIVGYADSRIGMNEISCKVGLSVSAGMGFTWGYFTEFPKRLESGLYLEYFKNGLPVMAIAKNRSVQTGLYFRLMFGKRILKN